MVFGLHPWEATGHDVVQEGLKSLEAALERSPAPVAIGETGLDRGRRHKSNLGYQRASLMGHLRLALERDLPVVLHVVQAHGLMLDILRDLPCPPRAVVHAFDASLEVAKGYEALGIHLSIGGRVCAPNARRLHRAAPQLNRSLLLIETDSPDQHPSGTAVELNEPANLLTIATRLAALRGEDPLEVGVYTAQNARRLFRLGV